MPAGDPSAHRFVFAHPDGTAAVRWNPCRPIHYVVNPAGGPADAVAMVAEAVARLGAATRSERNPDGLTFVFDGTTTALSGRSWIGQLLPTGYPPVIIGWALPGTSDLLPAGSAPAGVGAGAHTGVPGEYVTGYVLLNAARQPSQSVHVALLMHELAHVLGLDHVDDRTQLMNPVVYAGDLGAGDRAGLARLADTGAGCPPA